MQFDTIIVGGSFAGLAAATYLGRARRRVLVLDTGKPRNRFSAASHGFLGQDGRSPLDILTDARQQLEAYPTVQFRAAKAEGAHREGDGFAVSLSGGETLHACTLLLSFGLRDSLPDIPGVADRWGQSVLHCPYCHGFEFSDRPLGVLYRHDMSLHQAQLIAEWGPTTLFLDGAKLTGEQAKLLALRGVRVEATPVRALEGEGFELSSVLLNNGKRIPVEALYLIPQSIHSSPLADQLGLDITDTVMGPIVATDENKMTSMAGVFAAGDIARAPHSVSWAVADGVTAGTALHRALVFG